MTGLDYTAVRLKWEFVICRWEKGLLVFHLNRKCWGAVCNFTQDALPRFPPHAEIAAVLHMVSPAVASVDYCGTTVDLLTTAVV